MCGIAGYFGGSASGADNGVAAAMAQTLRHRGPDAEGFYHDGALHLAHRRLSVIDLTQGAQPMQTADGQLCIVYNGEIYNHPELRKELEARGHIFRTDHSDTEVLLHGWREWGAELPKHLNGMWAFALFDRQRQQLFLSRDRFGKKPLYYTRQNGVFAFASEMIALRAHPALSFDLDELSLRKYFAYAFIPAPRTVYKDVFKLTAGHNLTLDLATGAIRRSKYWEYLIKPDCALSGAPLPELCAQLREILARAVKRRMLSDVPLGVLLSGGVDSSCVAAFAAQNDPQLKTFSVGFNDASYDESPFARRVAQLLGTRHYESRLCNAQARELAPELLRRLDEPMADDSFLPTYLVCREARKEVTVALGGDGGDELFAGYEPFKVWRWGRRFDIYLPAFVQKLVQTAVGRVGASQGYMNLSLKLQRFFRASAYGMKVWVPALLAPLPVEEIAQLCGADCPLEELYSEAIESWEECQSADPADRITQYYVNLYLQNEILTKGDRAAMLNSLELRSPLLDLEVADFARRLPAGLRLRHGTGKYLLKKALEPLLPADILYRKKHGFSPPTGQWFLEGSLGFAPDAPRWGNVDFLRGQLEAHQSGRKNQTRYLWAQYVLDAFLAPR